MKKVFIPALIAALAVTLLIGSPAAADTKNNADTYRLLNLFGDVFERVRAEYVEEVSDEELIEAAITGMLTSLDPHSSYLNAKNFKDMQVQTRGKFGGLGIEVTMENGFVKVVSPIDDTPAARSGIKPGDFITHLDGKPVLGLTLGEAVELMRGQGRLGHQTDHQARKYRGLRRHHHPGGDPAPDGAPHGSRATSPTSGFRLSANRRPTASRRPWRNSRPNWATN